MITTVIAIWVAGIAARLILAMALSWRGLARAYRGLMLFLVAGSAKSLYLLWVCLYRQKLYADLWNRFEWVDLLLYSVIALEGYVVTARQYKRVASFATFIGCMFLLVAGILILSSAHILTASFTFSSVWMLVARNWGIACLLLCGGGYLFFDIFPRDMRPNVRWYCRGLMLFFAAKFFSLAALYAGETAQWFSHFIYTGLPVAIYVGWIAFLKPEGEVLPPAPEPSGSIEETSAALAEFVDELSETRRALARKKALRSAR